MICHIVEILTILLLAVSVHHGGCELFTALADMEEVLETESVLINNLEGYIIAQEKKLDYLRKKVEEYQREHDEAGKDVSGYLLNPINAYLLTKRLTSDWRDIEQIMNMDVGTQFIQNVTNYRDILKFPTEEDLTGAANALIRLQDTYNLDTASLARGELNGVQYSTAMSSEDCFEIGRQMYNNRDYHHTKLWMEEAINRLKNDSRLPYSELLEYLAFSTFKEGDVKAALKMTNELLTMVPDHQRAQGNKYYYEKELAKVNEKSVLRGDDGSDDLPVDKSLEFQHSKLGPYTYDLPEKKLYEYACRGEIKPEESFLATLTCRYVDNGIPFLKIAPLKLEQFSHDPWIVVYHDVASDGEIEVLKRMAKPRFKRATVQNHKTGELEVAHYRISKSAWLKDEEHQVVRDIVQRVVDMTNLDMSTAEELQVVNYGVAGHYEPHYDFARKEETNAFKSLNSGNRIATVLFYVSMKNTTMLSKPLYVKPVLSDVTQGGATVFPALKTAVWPKKGTAAFWFNLRRSGQGDYLTRHAACPVIVGSKWVANKWIHEAGNEFTRPCGLEIDHDMEF